MVGWSRGIVKRNALQNESDYLLTRVTRGVMSDLYRLGTTRSRLLLLHLLVSFHQLQNLRNIVMSRRYCHGPGAC